MFRRLDVNRHLILVQVLAMGEVTGRDALFFPPMRVIFHHRHSQVHFAGMRFRRRRDRIEPRRDLVRQREKFRRGERRRVLGQYVGIIPRVNEIIECLLVADDLRQRRLLAPLGQLLQHGLHEFLAYPVQDILMDQHLAQGPGSRRQVNRGLRIKPQMRQQIVHGLGEIARYDSQRIARNVRNPAVPQSHHYMARVLVGARARKRVVFSETGHKRIGPVVDGRGR